MLPIRFMLTLPAAFLVAFAPLYVSAQTSATPTGSPAPAPPAVAAPASDADTVLPIAKAEFLAWQSGKIDPAHYVDGSLAGISDATKTAVTQGLGALGPLQSFTLLGKGTDPKGNAYSQYTAACKNGSAIVTIALDTKGKISGIYFKPA